MNAESQHQKPLLLLLFSEFSIDDVNRLLSTHMDIILRSKLKNTGAKSKNIKEDQRPDYSDISWNIQYEGLELEIQWFQGYLNINSYKQLFCNIDEASFQSGIAISFGSHIKDGYKNAAIISSLFRYIRLLIMNSNSIAIVWNINNIISDSQYFVDVVNHYEKGGAFPILSTVDFIYDEEGILKSKGLSYFANQEIHYECRQLHEVDAMKRMMRIAHDVAVNGAYSNSMELDGIEGDERIYITIDKDSRIARVRSVFKLAVPDSLK